MMIDYIGQRRGRLVCIAEAPKKNGIRMLICQCDCGNQTTVYANNFQKGHTLSCGCLKKEIIAAGAHTKHGCRNTRLYEIWRSMKQRCYNPNKINYDRYGGRGITVCEEWKSSFESFSDWAKENGYADDLSIDRIDNDGNYCPENCRWVSVKEQANNRRSNHYLELNGEKKTIAEWSDELSIPQSILIGRVYHGWDDERVLTQPVRKY